MKIPAIPPPEPPKFAPRRTMDHGIERVDPFHEMREIDNPQVRAYLKDENAYFRNVAKGWHGIEARVRREIDRRIPKDDCSVPVRIDDWFYYVRTKAGSEYPFYCRKNALRADAHEEVILDINRLAGKSKCCLVTGVAVSPDHNFLCYGINRTGGIDYTIRIRDLANGRMLRDSIGCTDGEAVWTADNSTLFYAKRRRGDLRAWRVMRHRLGTAVREDICVYQEDDPTFECSVWKTKSDRFIVVSASSATTAEHRYIEASVPESEFKLMFPRVDGVEYYPEHLGKYFYFLSNADAASDFKLLRVPVGKFNTAKTEVVLRHRRGVLLEDFELFDNAIAILERADALPKIRFIDPKTLKTKTVFSPDLPPPYAMAFDENPNIDSPTVRIAYSSLVMPGTVSEISLKDYNESILKRRTIPGYDPALYDSTMLRVPSRDGKAAIPLSLVWRKDTQHPASVLLRAYGAYGISSDTAFRASRISLLDRGVICAVAHVRGGEELGRAWYEGGRLFNKKNTFTDTVDCAEYLIAQGWTHPKKLVISGGSAGGLLVGAVINERPELFHAAVMEVPFVDVVNTMMDPELPLTTGEYKEWGDPADPRAFEYILSYSPYDNICGQKYPHVLLLGSLNDAQVPYWEPAKFAAKLRTVAKRGSLVLLRTDMESGHLGRTGRKAEIAEVARELGFVLYMIGDDSDG